MAEKSKKIEYKFNEARALKDLKWYIDQTYSSHYSRNKYQSTEFIIDGGHGEGFCIGNILKYSGQVAYHVYLTEPYQVYQEIFL